MREASQPSSVIEFGPFRFDSASGRLMKKGSPIRLNGMPVKVLDHLLARPGELVSRAELQRVLWSDTTYGNFEQGLNSVVNLLRRALSDNADQPHYIETVPGQGYRFIAPIRDVSTETQSLNRPPEPPLPSTEFQQVDASLPLPQVFTSRQHTGLCRLRIGAALFIAVAVGLTWLTLRRDAKTLLDGSTRPSANSELNDQFNLAFHFLGVQNDTSLALKASERAVALDPTFAPAHLQHATFTIIEFFAGVTNDPSLLLKAEQEVYQAEPNVSASDGALLNAKTAVFLSQGRLDRVPLTKLEELSRNGGDPTWLAIIRMLSGQTDEAISLLRGWLDHRPLDNPARMFLGELLRTKGDTANAIRLLERNLQQGPRHMTPALYLTLAYLDAGQPTQARALLLRMRPEFERNYLWRHAWAILLAAEGRHDVASEYMDQESLNYARSCWEVWTTTAEFYALQGDRVKALEWLQFAVNRGDERASYFSRNSRFSLLRGDVGFQLLLHDLALRQAAFRHSSQ